MSNQYTVNINSVRNILAVEGLINLLALLLLCLFLITHLVA